MTNQAAHPSSNGLTDAKTAASPHPNAYLVGRRVWLRALTEEDAEGAWHTWFSDQDANPFLTHWRPNTAEQQKAFYRTQVMGSSDLILAVCLRADNRHVGVVSIRGIDWQHRFGAIALVIGDQRAQAEATIGLEAFALMVRVGFTRLNLLNLIGGYMAGQQASEHILRAMRFKEVGRYHGLFDVGCAPMDKVLVQLSRSDWLKRNPEYLRVSDTASE